MQNEHDIVRNVSAWLDRAEIVRKPTGYGLQELKRRLRTKIQDFETWIVSKEDVTLSKLFLGGGFAL
ncbi:MAG: hypothetical protein ACK45B_04620 [Limisphaerales bacterium]